MRRLSAARVAVLVLLVGAGLPASAVSAGATTASTTASSASTLYVANSVPCSDTGEGSMAQPFCTISAAVAAVVPGQTVRVEPGSYREQVRITRPGTDSAPIVFVAENSPQGVVRVFADSMPGPAISVSGARDVTLRGFTAFAGSGADAFLVSDSSGVTIEQGAAHAPAVGVRVTGASSGVSIRQVSIVGTRTAGVEVDAGVTGTVVTTNTIVSPTVPGQSPATGVLATDAPGTVVTSNTIFASCAQGISVAGASSNSSIENNIVENAGGPVQAPVACRAPFASAAVSVSAGSANGTKVDFNLADPTGGGPLYSWSGSAYPTPAAFTAATGQGVHDLAAPPQLTTPIGGDISWYPLSSSSPAIDSADADAPGELPVDYLGAPRQDQPDVANTGVGKVAYADRGAVEYERGTSSGSPQLVPSPGGGPFDIDVSVPGAGYTGAPSGPSGASFSYQFDDEPFPVNTTDAVTRHTFQRAGYHHVSVFVSDDGFRTGLGTSFGDEGIVVGADYTPVSPTRLLDTRSRIGTPTTTPLAPGADLLLPIGNIDGTPASDLTAVAVNVTVTEPTDTGFLTVYPDGRSLPNASNLNFTPGLTVPNLVTVPVDGGGIRFHNSSGGTVHVVADLAGYFSGKGLGFKPLAPVRVLDTRTGLGSSAAQPVAAGGTLLLDLSGRLPAGATAAILNMTVTEPKDVGFLTAYPAGQALPNASNLNFTPGLTVANLVFVPVSNGKIDLRNSSFGTVHVVADLAGYFGTPDSGATLSYVPEGPVRVADTRDGTGIPRPAGAVTAQGGISIYPAEPLGTQRPVSVLLNVTVTEPTDAGFLTAYPDGQTRPTASNLNFTPGHTVPNLVCVPVSDGGVRIDNGSFGSVQIVVDEQGYFIDAHR